MGTADAADGERQEIWFFGAIPPPVTGMTVLTREILFALQSAGSVKFLNWSPGTTHRSIFARARRIWRVVASIAQLLWRGHCTGQRLYLAANSRAGLYFTAVLVFVSQRLGYAVYLHHHVYSYIDKFDWRMAWIDRHLGANGAHIVHAERMANDFRKQYNSQNSFVILSPSIIPIEVGQPRHAAHAPFRLGMLSNLTIEKGLEDTIDAFEQLRRRDQHVSLTLAGPIRSRRANRLVKSALSTYPHLIKYLGPVYGDAKALFFSEIDAFVFPTRTESWGIVLQEALAAGVPVITCDRGCTATVVGQRAGLVVSDASAFPAEAAQHIAHWMDNEQAYREASEAAIEQAKYLHHEGERTLAEFADHIFQIPAKATQQSTG